MSNKIICPRFFSQNFSLCCNHQFAIDNPKKIVYLIILNVLYVVLLRTYTIITNIILNSYVSLKNVIITLVLLNPLYF